MVEKKNSQKQNKAAAPVTLLRYCLIAIVPERVESTAIIPSFKII